MFVEVEKPRIHTLWIDTSVYIKIALAKEGKLPGHETKRILDLYDFIKYLVQAEKIICPMGAQHEEVWRQEETFHRLQVELSKGVKFLHYTTVEKSQVYLFMRSFAKGKTRVFILVHTAFEQDPIEEIKRRKAEGTIVTVLPRKVESIGNLKLRRSRVCNELERLRKKNIADGITYEEQLEKEYAAGLEKIKMDRDELNAYLQCWDRIDGKPEGLSGLLPFFLSSAYRQVPLVSLESGIYAHILTGNASVRTGDLMDIHHLSAVIPYCHSILTDKAVANIIIQRGLAELYGTRVFSLHTIESLYHVLEKA